MKLNDLLNIKENGGSVIDALCKLELSITGEDYNNLETNAVFEGGVSYDSDLEMLFSELNVCSVTFIEPDDLTFTHTSIEGMKKDSSYVFIADDEIGLVVPMVSETNRHGDDLGDEVFVFFEELIEVPSDIMDHCDLCKKPYARDILVNISPDSELDDLQDGYEELDGMICPKCYCSICKEEFLQN